jgi:hypothetical protein
MNRRPKRTSLMQITEMDQFKQLPEPIVCLRLP